MNFEQVEVYFFKDLSDIKQEIKSLDLGYNIYKAIRIIDGKTILARDYYDIEIYNGKLEEGKLYFDVDGKFMEIDEEIFNDEEARELFYKINYKIKFNDGCIINKEFLLKEKERITEEKRKEEEEQEKDEEEIFKEQSIIDRKGTYKIEENTIKKDNNTFIELDKNFNEIFDYDEIRNLNLNTFYKDELLLDFVNTTINNNKNIKFKVYKTNTTINIKIENKKIFFEGVKIQKNKLKMIYYRYGNRIKTKEDIETFNKLSIMKVDLLNKNKFVIRRKKEKYDYEDIEFELKFDLADEKGNKFYVEGFGFNNKVNWEFIKEKLFYGRRLKNYITLNTLCDLFNCEKQKILDELKKIYVLNKI